MRTEVFKLLDSSNMENKTQNSKQSSDIVIFNELVREYLNWMGFKYSSTVFVAGRKNVKLYHLIHVLKNTIFNQN